MYLLNKNIIINTSNQHFNRKKLEYKVNKLYFENIKYYEFYFTMTTKFKGRK